DALALTERAAHRLFPAGDALGKTVDVRGHAMTVVALMARSPRTVLDEPGDAWASFDSPITAADPAMLGAWTSMQGKVVARVADGHSAAEVGAAAQALFDNGPGARATPPDWTRNGRKGAFLRATPLTRQYLEGGGG